jgi:hypothetical protein
MSYNLVYVNSHKPDVKVESIATRKKTKKKKSGDVSATEVPSLTYKDELPPTSLYFRLGDMCTGKISYKTRELKSQSLIPLSEDQYNRTLGSNILEHWMRAMIARVLHDSITNLKNYLKKSKFLKSEVTKSLDVDNFISYLIGKELLYEDPSYLLNTLQIGILSEIGYHPKPKEAKEKQSIYLRILPDVWESVLISINLMIEECFEYFISYIQRRETYHVKREKLTYKSYISNYKKVKK